MVKTLKNKHLSFLLIALFGLFFTPQNLLASEEAGAEHETEPWNAGETIIHHVLDAHEMHIFDGFTIPLPVIMYSDLGMDIFMSSAFHHGTEPYISNRTGITYEMHEGHIMAHTASGEEIHPMDFSITKNVVGMFMGLIIMFWLFVGSAKGYVKNRGEAPKGVQAVMEPLILFIRDEVAKPSIGEKHYERFTPFLLTVFFFILICNFLGLIPFLGGMNVTGNIAVTMILALFTFIVTNMNGNKNYWKHIFAPSGVPIPVMLILVPIKILQVFLKPMVLMLRLFANITAGHIIILSFICLIFIFNQEIGPGTAAGVSIASMAFSIFMNILEILVAFLQAYVFTLLSALYFGQAVEEHH